MEKFLGNLDNLECFHCGHASSIEYWKMEQGDISEEKLQ